MYIAHLAYLMHFNNLRDSITCCKTMQRQLIKGRGSYNLINFWTQNDKMILTVLTVT